MALYYRRTPGQSDLFDQAHAHQTQRCGHCAARISDEADQCPFCGMYVLPTTALGRRPWWFIAALILCLVIMVLWVLGRG